MRRSQIPVFALVTTLLMLLTSCGGGGGGGTTAGSTTGSAAVLGSSSSYYPTTTGSAWAYKVTLTGYSPYTDTAQVQSDGRIKITYAINNVTYTTYETYVKSANTISLTESVTSSSLGTSTTTYSSGSQLPDFSNSSVQSLISKGTSSYVPVNGQPTTNNFQETDEVTLIGQETITVSAGTFNTIKYSIQRTTVPSTSGPSTSLIWFALGVGLVKTIGSDGSTSELVSYSVVPDVSVSVNISPNAIAMNTNASNTFSAIVTGASNTAVTWKVVEGSSGGTISSSGVYTSPSTAGTYHVQATSISDPTKSATAAIAVAAPVTVEPFPVGTWVNAQHNVTITVNSLVNTLGTDGYYSGSVSYPAFTGGTVNISGNLISTNGTIVFVQNETLVATANTASGTNVTSFSFGGDDTIFLTQPISSYSGLLTIVSGVNGYSYSGRVTFVKQ